MIGLQIYFLVGIIIVLLLLYWKFHKREYMVDSYFIKKLMHHNEKFEYVTIKSYYSSGYYLSYHCGKNIFQVKDIKIDTLYGAKIDSLMDDVRFNLGIEKGNLYHTLLSSNSIVIKLKKDVKLVDVMV